ncbi:Long chain base biosynthesis protein 1-like [Thalictrum thalictroides]|uniref:Long chain base biosynthesis protein 1-like n=1 Tax=Thalictrum thalictroides TaxID=46969 RepID=A0A7J6WS90_THATH|nr:Long chain base biosynthesis protein 1-like [Thalictrum thalictroides]
MGKKSNRTLELLYFIFILLTCAGLSTIPCLTVLSNPLSPLVYVKLSRSTGSFQRDSHLLETIVDHMLKEDCVLVTTSRRSTLDKCTLPAGIRLYVSAAHTESDILKASESLKRVSELVVAE